MAIAFTQLKLTRFFGFAIVSAIAASSTASQMKPSLYERMGGIHKIAALIDTVNEECRTDPALWANERFAMANKLAPAAAIKFLLTGYFANRLGGPQGYNGPDIARVEKWFNYTSMQRKREDAYFIGTMVKMGYTRDVVNDFEAWWMNECAKAEPLQPMLEDIQNKESLYGRLGGFVAIAAVTDDFVNRLATDKTLLANPHTVMSLTSGRVSAAGLKYLVTEQLCVASGGPFKYSGRTMAASHKGLQISENEWTAGAKLLIESLNKFNVPSKEQGEVLAAVASTKGDIVGH